MAAPNSKELEILVKLSEDQKSHMHLLRWLRAREYNLEQSESMLRKSLKWREENDIDSLLTWEGTENLIKNYQLDLSGFDKESCPVSVLQFGKWNLKKLIQSGEKMTYIRYIDQLFEKLLHSMKGKTTAAEAPVTQFVIIMDMDCLSMKTLISFGVVDTIMENLRRFECNHPETLKLAYVINSETSRVFSILFSIVKPILSQRTFGKVQIFDSDATKWRPALFAAIPRDQLSTFYGETRAVSQLENNDHNKLSTLSLNKNTEEDENSLDSMISITVGAAQVLSVEIQVNQESSILNWVFKTELFDIGFSITLFDQEVVPKQRVKPHINPAEGSLVCHEVGAYVFHFDNSFSRLRSKSLIYKIDVIDPETTTTTTKWD